MSHQRFPQRSSPSAPASVQVVASEVQQQLTVDKFDFLPSPAALKGYAEVLSDAPQRLMALMEEQVHHRIESERRTLDTNILAIQDNMKLQRLYAWMAFLLALSLIAAFVAVSFFTRNAYVSVGGLVLTIGGIITTFLVESRRRLRLQRESQQSQE